MVIEHDVSNGTKFVLMLMRKMNSLASYLVPASLFDRIEAMTITSCEVRYGRRASCRRWL